MSRGKPRCCLPSSKSGNTTGEASSMVDWSKVPYHKVLRIPSMPPGPLNWADEISGKLTDAVLAFFKGGPLTPEHFELVRGYCEYYVRAPCWEAKPFMDESDRAALAMLRTSNR